MEAYLTDVVRRSRRLKTSELTSEGEGVPGIVTGDTWKPPAAAFINQTILLLASQSPQPSWAKEKCENRPEEFWFCSIDIAAFLHIQVI